MTKKIEVNTKTFENLQKISINLNISIDSVISKSMNALLQAQKRGNEYVGGESVGYTTKTASTLTDATDTESNKNQTSQEASSALTERVDIKNNKGQATRKITWKEIKDWYPTTGLDLLKTQIKFVKINGAEQKAFKWNPQLIELLKLAIDRYGCVLDELNKICTVQKVDWEKNYHTYRFYKDLGISVLGKDSNYCCKYIVETAINLGLQLDIEVELVRGSNSGRIARISVDNEGKYSHFLLNSFS